MKITAKQKALLHFCLLSILTLPNAAQCEEAQNYGTMSIYWENDALAKTDSNYTNGVKLTWTSPWISWQPDGDSVRPATTPWYHSLIKALPFVYSPGFQSALYVAVGQNIYTPDDLNRTTPNIYDRPYAGYLYLGMGFLKKTDWYMDAMEVDIGIVGRHSYAEDAQEWVHKILGQDDPKGWDNQLHDEPTLELIYERKWKWLKTETGNQWGFDLIPHMGGRVGNVYIYANAGAELRFGWNRPDDYGTCLIRPGCENGAVSGGEGSNRPESSRLGVYFFLGAEGRAIAHDIFLDGNTFRSSQSVEKKQFVADFMAGVGFTMSSLKVSYAVIYRTKQFDTQPSNEQIFGSMLITYFYK